MARRAPRGPSSPGLRRVQRTMPETPSTATWTPSGIRAVAAATPSTSGIPRSRASEARCEVLPPSSVTTAATLARTWISAGLATFVTRTSPGATRPSSHSHLTTHARPDARPMPAGSPVTPRWRGKDSSGTCAAPSRSGRACRSLNPAPSSAHSISTGTPSTSSARKSRRPSSRPCDASRQARAAPVDRAASCWCAHPARCSVRPGSVLRRTTSIGCSAPSRSARRRAKPCSSLPSR